MHAMFRTSSFLPAGRRPATRPCLEDLEDRLTPSSGVHAAPLPAPAPATNALAVLLQAAKPTVVQSAAMMSAAGASQRGSPSSEGMPGPSPGELQVEPEPEQHAEPEAEMEVEVEPPQDVNHLLFDQFRLTLDRVFLAFEQALNRVDPHLEAEIEGLQKAISSSPLNGTPQGQLAEIIATGSVLSAMGQTSPMSR
jgi:hypothetical protein